MPASERARGVGRVARVGLVPGSLVVPDVLARSDAVPAGRSVVALLLRFGQAPTLAPGDLVRVVAPAQELDAAAQVFAVERQGQGSEDVRVSVLADDATAARIAGAAAGQGQMRRPTLVRAVSLVVLASAKGSPGVSTAALALCAVWAPERDVLLAEADPAGSALAPRFGLGYERGVASLAPACRHHFLVGDIAGHTQPLPLGAGRPGIEVLLGVRAGEQARVLRRFWDGFGAPMANLEAMDVVVDCGRLWPDSPTVGLVLGAPTVLLVTRPDAEGVVAAQLRATALVEAGLDVDRLAVVVVGDRPYGAAEVAEALDVPVAATLAHDPATARLLGGQRPNRRLKLTRSALLRSTRSLADWLEARPAIAASPGLAAPPNGTVLSGISVQEVRPHG